MSANGTKATRARWLAALVVGVVMALSFVQPTLAVGRDMRFAALRALGDASHSYMGDPGPSIAAARRLREDPHARVYDADLSVGSAFIYPPIAALLYTPVATLSPEAAREALSGVSLALFLAITVMLVVFVDAKHRWPPMVAACVACVVYYPLIHAVELNQATMLVTALVGGALLAFDARRDALAGVLFALTFAIKPHLALALPLLAWHARSAVASALATSAALFAASLAYAGVGNHVDYATKVLPALSNGYAYYANQSWNGLFHRLASGDIDVLALPAASRAMSIATIAFGGATYAAALFAVRRWRDRDVPAAWVFAFAWLVVTLVSPVAWQHHYAPALFVFALVARAGRARLVVAVAFSFALMASYFEVRQLEGTFARVAVSYVFFGALVLAIALERIVDGLSLTAPEPRAGTR